VGNGSCSMPTWPNSSACRPSGSTNRSSATSIGFLLISCLPWRLRKKPRWPQTATTSTASERLRSDGKLRIWGPVRGPVGGPVRS